MSISSVFHNEDLRKQIFKYKKIECLLNVQSVRQRENFLECIELIDFAYEHYLNIEFGIDFDDDFVKFLHYDCHFDEDGMYCKGCGVGLICSYSKERSYITEIEYNIRVEPEWYEPENYENLNQCGWMCKCCMREFGLN